MAAFVQTVSGHAVLPAWGGPANFLNVDGLAWTDQQGLCQNDGKRFRLRGGRSVDFYVPVTNPLIVNDAQMRADFAAVTLELPATAPLISFQVWDRTTIVFSSPPLFVTGSFRRLWVENSNAFRLADAFVVGNLSIKLTVLALGDSDVLFTGAGIRFHN
jgi:hypothetical protein